VIDSRRAPVRRRSHFGPVQLLAVRAVPALAPERAPFRAYQTYLCDDYGIADGIVAAFARSFDEATRAAMRSWIDADLARLPRSVDSAMRLSCSPNGSWCTHSPMWLMPPATWMPIARRSSGSDRRCAMMSAWQNG
jgi:hypothetical protein